jgi:mannose-6-phosphate isomerase-like protein (cupin superfamily)
MIETCRIDRSAAEHEFGTFTQRLTPWPAGAGETPFGQMACFVEPGTETAPDRHSQDEIVVVLAGTADVRVDGETVRISRGELAFLPGDSTHVVRNASDEQLVFMSIYWPLHEPTAEEDRRA